MNMIGKKNIVFGFLYLVLTAALGPYMVVNMLPDMDNAMAGKQASVGRLQQLKTNEFEEDLEPLAPEQIAMANTDGILALNKITNTQVPLNLMRSAHAHGNLEAVLNILAGFALCFMALAKIVKQVISWLFISGALLHSGMIYLANFGQDWAFSILPIGPWLVLAALLSAGIGIMVGFRGELVQDK